MAEIPSRLQCAYCLRNQTHGGECEKRKFDDIGCLIFKIDPKGCIRSGDLKIPLPLYKALPPIGKWMDDYTVYGVDTLIRITRIWGLSWDTKKGYLIIHASCDYYVNEYSKKYKKESNKPDLKIIK